MFLQEKIVTTDVDRLIELLKSSEKITLTDAAKQLNVAVNILQKWVDFLVEEKIVGVEYKFTTPYIYYAQPQEDKNEGNLDKLSIDDYKEEFYENAQAKAIPKMLIEKFWNKHLQNIIQAKKAFFAEYCRQKKIDNTEELFEKFKTQIIV